MADGGDLYDVLGVAPTATTAEVRAAYRVAARRNHPDAGGDPRRMQQLNAAWRVLGDPTRRAAYDDLQARRAAAGLGAVAPRPAGPDDEREHDDPWLDPDLYDARPFGPTRALEGWWAILPPGALAGALVLLFGGFYFTSAELVALSAGAFVLALGLFVLAPLRAMTKRPGGDRDRE